MIESTNLGMIYRPHKSENLPATEIQVENLPAKFLNPLKRKGIMLVLGLSLLCIEYFNRFTHQ